MNKMEKQLQTRTKDFTSIPINRGAYEKLNSYGILSGSNECYGLLLTPKNQNHGIIYDVILAPNQTVSGSHAGITGTTAMNAKQEIDSLGYKTVGFWHSHGNHPVFHSGTDNNNMNKLLPSIASNTKEIYSIKNEDGCFPKKDSTIIRLDGKELEIAHNMRDISIQETDEIYSELTIGGTMDQLRISFGRQMYIINNFNGFKKKKCHPEILGNIGVAYSIVVNKKEKYYGEIGISSWCNTCERLETEVRKNVGLTILSRENDISFTKKRLKKDLQERVLDFNQ